MEIVNSNMYKNNIFLKLCLVSVILLLTSLIYFAFKNESKNTFEYYNIQKYVWEDNNSKAHEELLAGGRLSGNFIAKDDDLANISIPFKTFNRINSDIIVFRIKEEGSKNWYFQKLFNTNGQFQNDIPYAFTVPIIKNSKNKAYYFEIESLKGSPGDAISASNKNFFIIKYKLTKSELTNVSKLIGFIFTNTFIQIFSLSINAVFISILLSLIPFILFGINKYWSFILYLLVKLYTRKGFFNLDRIFDIIKSNFFTFIQHNSVTIMILCLLIIIETGTFYNYEKFPVISSTEARLAAYPSNDFYTAVYYRTEQMIKRKEMDISVIYPNEIDASGQFLPLLFSPFLLLFKPDRYLSYFFFLGAITIVYIIFFTLLMKKLDKQILNAGLIFLIAFFISEPGLLGVYMGNIDILLAPLVGILILTVFHFLQKKSISFIQAIGLGLLAGSLVNIKITILPFVLLVVFFSKRSFLILGTIIVVFLAFVYAPNFFGSKSDLMLHIHKIAEWNNIHPFAYRLWTNHSVYAIASLFTGCIEVKACDTQIANKLIALFLFLFTFVTPFLLSRPIQKIVVNKGNFTAVPKLRRNKALALVLFVFSVVLINLPFRIVYDYRLFFSLPVILIILKESAEFKKALTFCYMSMFLLLLGGIWAIQLNPNEAWTIDARFLKFFIIFHFFFLILSALTYWKESQKNRLQNILELRNTLYYNGKQL